MLYAGGRPWQGCPFGRRAPGEEAKLKFQRILVPLALDAGEAPTLAVAKKLASSDGGTVFLLHILGESEPQDEEGPARNALEEMARLHLDTDVPREILIGTGDAASVIIEFERAIPADLVVMRSHARVTRLRKALGTVSERVVRESLCPVLVVPQVI
jgi:nucleotide-binding universal stress UspA family protein